MGSAEIIPKRRHMSENSFFEKSFYPIPLKTSPVHFFNLTKPVMLSHRPFDLPPAIQSLRKSDQIAGAKAHLPFFRLHCHLALENPTDLPLAVMPWKLTNLAGPDGLVGHRVFFIFGGLSFLDFHQFHPQ